MALPFPFEPVNITSLKAEFPHINWNRWPHLVRGYEHAASTSELCLYRNRMANAVYAKMSQLEEDHNRLYYTLSSRHKNKLPRTIKELLDQMRQQPRSHVAWGTTRSMYDFLAYESEPQIIWALVVRNPWLLARDLQRICLAPYIKTNGNVKECLYWRETDCEVGYHGSIDMFYKLSPFIYENPTISTAVARCGLQSPDAVIRDLVAHAITKPPPCIGLVAKFIEVALINNNLPQDVAEIITVDYLYDPWSLNDWNEEYMNMRICDANPDCDDDEFT